jgi:hypothetical protein
MLNKTKAEMIGDAMRESAILLAVFGILDKFLRSEGPSLLWATSVLSVALSSFVVGCTIERLRG